MSYRTRAITVAMAVWMSTLTTVLPGQVHSFILEDGNSIVRRPSGGTLPTSTEVLHTSLQALVSDYVMSGQSSSAQHVDALSYGRDFGYYQNSHSYFVFSVGRESDPEDGTPLANELKSERAADLFWAQDVLDTRRGDGTHGKAADENTASDVPINFPRNNYFQMSASLGLPGTYGNPSSSTDPNVPEDANVIAFDYWDEGASSGKIYFSLSEDVDDPAGPFPIFHKADILVWDAGVVDIFVPRSQLGLSLDDNIASLAINLGGDEFVDGEWQKGYPSTGWYTLAPGSPSLNSGDGFLPADIFQFEVGINYESLPLSVQLHRTAESLGLAAGSSPIDTCIDAIGHIDPETIQNFSRCRTSFDGSASTGGVEGYLGAVIDPCSGQVVLPPEFVPFSGSYEIEFNGLPQGLILGTDEAPLAGLLSNPSLRPGDQVHVELYGKKFERDLVDLNLVEIPVVWNAPDPVSDLIAVTDPAGSITWTWSSPESECRVRLNGGAEEIVQSMSVGPDYVFFWTLADPAPGQHSLTVQSFAGGDQLSTTRFASAEWIPSVLLQPPHSLALSEDGTLLSWENPTAIGFDCIRIEVDGAEYDVLCPGAGVAMPTSCDFPGGLSEGLHLIQLTGRFDDGTPVTIASALQSFRLECPPPIDDEPYGSIVSTQLSVPLPTGDTVVEIDLGNTAGQPVHNLEVELQVEAPHPEALRITLSDSLTSGTEPFVILVDSVGVTGTSIRRHFDAFCTGSDCFGRGDTTPIDPDGGLEQFDGASLNTLYLIVQNRADPAVLEKVVVRAFVGLLEPCDPTLAEIDCATDALGFEFAAATDYDDISWDVLANGMSIATGSTGGYVPAGALIQDSIVLSGVDPGIVEIEITAMDSNGDVSQGTLPPVGWFPYNGESDVIVRAEGPGGLVDSASALANALTANGRSVMVIDLLGGDGDRAFDLDRWTCRSDLGPDNIVWWMGGTCPNDTPLTQQEGTALRDLVMNQGVGVYFESSDAWGLHPPTEWFDVDGVDGLFADGNVVLDGGDTLTQISGVASGLVDTSAFGIVDYAQDSSGNDSTDELEASSGVFPGDEPAAATYEVIWRNSDDAIPAGPGEADFGVAVARDAQGQGGAGNTISQSFEFGGFQGDQQALASAYVEFLMGSDPTTTPFIRGDSEGDGSVNIADAIFTLNAVFTPGAPRPACDDAADANDDGSINIADGIFTLSFLFAMGPQPASPYPACGEDPTGDSIVCGFYNSCP